VAFWYPTKDVDFTHPVPTGVSLAQWEAQPSEVLGGSQFAFSSGTLAQHAALCGACAPQVPEVLPGLGNADLRGLTQVYASPQTPRSVKDQIVATRTDVLEETECDFSVVGERLLQESEKANYKPCSAIWTHPTSGGQLFIANQASATSKDVLQEHKVGFIDPDVRYLYYPVAYWREAASDRSPKSDLERPRREDYFPTHLRVLKVATVRVLPAWQVSWSNLVGDLITGVKDGQIVAEIVFHKFKRLCNLDFKSALCAAKVARPSVDPMAHLQALLRKFLGVPLPRFELAKRHGVVEKAVEQARQQGFQVFNIKPPKQGPSSESNAL
ncbi:unnamed protein product, partial [Cladocopium goreaui]